MAFYWLHASPLPNFHTFLPPCLSLFLSSHIFKGCRPWRGRGVPWAPLVLADQLTLSQPGGVDYAHNINIGTLEFSNLPMVLKYYLSLKYLRYPNQEDIGCLKFKWRILMLAIKLYKTPKVS